MTFISEAFFSGCISKVINDIKDYSWAKIKSVINDKNDQNLSTRIYRVIEKVLIKVTDNKFKSMDILYEAIEKIFIEFRDHRNTIESVKCGLGMLNSDVTVERCKNFLERFYEEICQDEALYKIISLVLKEKGIEINQKEFQQINKKMEYGFNQLNRKIDNLTDSTIENSSINGADEIRKNLKFQNNKKQKYIENWNSRLFLHVDDDENPITLADAFIMPKFSHYIKAGSIKLLDKDSLTEAIEKFIRYDKTSSLLITGSPGIGKTSIISWIAYKYKFNESVIILRFRDWRNKDLAKGLFNAICNSLNCESVDLENKVLIIDGFDEIKSVNERKSLIHDFFNDILDFENLKVIITSRPDYLATYDFQNVFKVLPFDISQIKEFYQIIKGEALDPRNIDRENLDVLGIPVILYMAIMSDINLTLQATRPELYKKIFAEKGGIFDKFCFKGIGYDGGFQPLRDENNVKIYLLFLQQIAFSMFEKNDLVLTAKEYNIPELIFQGDKLKVVEFPIKPFFESDGDNIEFIHKSIYDFFVSESIFNSIMEVIDISEERSAEIFGKMFKKGFILRDTLDFLNSRISNSRIKDKFVLFNDIFNLMLQDGMTYYSREHYKNTIDCEMNIFANMLEVIHLWKSRTRKFNANIIDYIKSNKRHILNLNEIDLSESNLERIGLEKSSAVASVLREANLGRADLRSVDLRGADLKFANFSYANLFNANLANAILIEADLRGADLTKANLSKAKINASIWYKDDISKILAQLRIAEFTYIIVEDQEQRKLYRSVLFPDEN